MTDLAENVCEHGDHAAPDGKRFCSRGCEQCEHESTSENGCDGICVRPNHIAARLRAAVPTEILSGRPRLTQTLIDAARALEDIEWMGAVNKELFESQKRLVSEVRKAHEDRDEARRERDVFSRDSLAAAKDAAHDAMRAAERRELDALAELDEARAALVAHQTAPDPNDPDGWVRRSALNHWCERAATAEHEAATLRTENERLRAEVATLTKPILARSYELAKLHDDVEGLRAENERLRRHYDAAGPDHNLLALLDLYFEERGEAREERDAAKETAARNEQSAAKAWAKYREVKAAGRAVAEAARGLTSWDWSRLLVDHPDANELRADAARIEAALRALDGVDS